MNNLTAIVYSQLLKEAIYFGNIKNCVYFDFVIKPKNKRLVKNSRFLGFKIKSKKTKI